MHNEQPRRRQTQFTRAARTKRILERLREGWAYDEVAREERLAERRVRQIVTQYLQEREPGSDADHAQMQIDRLGRALRPIRPARPGLENLPRRYCGRDR